MSTKSKPSNRPTPPRVRRPAANQHRGEIVRALERAGLKISARRGVTGDLDAIITRAVGRVVKVAAGKKKPGSAAKPAPEDENNIGRLVGAGIPRRGGSMDELPWASDEDVDTALDLAKTLSATEIAARLHTTRVTVNAWRKEGRLLGVQGAKRGVRYPAEQIGPNFVPLPVLDIIKALDDDHWAAWRFLADPVHELGGDIGFELLKAGKLDELKSVLEGRAYGAFS
jgi:hypothetical protein